MKISSSSISHTLEIYLVCKALHARDRWTKRTAKVKNRTYNNCFKNETDSLNAYLPEYEIKDSF